MLFLPSMTNLCLTNCPAITPPTRKNQQPPVKGSKTINGMSASTFPNNKSINITRVKLVGSKSKGEHNMVVINAVRYPRSFVNTIGSSCSDHHSLVGISTLP